jgi:hypothetical protein
METLPPNETHFVYTLRAIFHSRRHLQHTCWWNNCNRGKSRRAGTRCIVLNLTIVIGGHTPVCDTAIARRVNQHRPRAVHTIVCCDDCCVHRVCSIVNKNSSFVCSAYMCTFVRQEVNLLLCVQFNFHNKT